MMSPPRSGALDATGRADHIVGHSWGGTVITTRVHTRTLWAWSTFLRSRPMPVSRRRSTYQGFAATPEFVIETQKDGFGFLACRVKAGFARDASDADAAFLRDSQVPIHMSVFENKLKNAAWRTKRLGCDRYEDKAFDKRCWFIWQSDRADITGSTPAMRPS